MCALPRLNAAAVMPGQHIRHSGGVMEAKLTPEEFTLLFHKSTTITMW
jgi:hypothetical protein